MAELCEARNYNRWTMMTEFKDYVCMETLKDSKYPEDYISEVADSLVPVYNSELIDWASHYSGEEYWDIWSEESFGETPLDMLRYNVYSLYNQVGHEFLQSLEEE